MGTVSRIRPTTGPAVAAAVDAFLSTLDHPETAGTWRVYAGTLRALRSHLGPATPLSVLEGPAMAAGLVDWFTRRWGERAPATFNRNRTPGSGAIALAASSLNRSWMRLSAL